MEVSFLASVVEDPSQNAESLTSTRLRADRALAEYRDARNSLASFLLAENPQDDEAAYAVRLVNVIARGVAA